MGNIASQFATAFRDFITDGVASSGPHDVIKEEVRAIGPLIESALANVSLGALLDVVKATRSDLNADLAFAANSVALVYGDATDANNDLYTKVGASGGGSWTLTTILHDTLEAIAGPFALRAGNAVPFDTWADLAATTGMIAGDRATVLSGDTGTHTDPVVGGTVANAGVYEYSASPAGWERVANLDSQTASAAAATIAAERALLAILAAQFALPGYIVNTYGALSRAQAGAGIATAATSITSGNAAAHWQISGGRLFRTSTGVSAGMGEGAYLLTLDNGEKHAIMMEANAWDVATQTEWDFVALQSAATLAGKKIALRNSTLLNLKITGLAATPFRRGDYRDGLGNPAIIEGRFGGPGAFADYCEVTGAPLLRGARGVTFKHLKTGEAASAKFSFVGEAANVTDDVSVLDCWVRGAPGDPYGDYVDSSLYPMRNLDLINTTGSAAASVGNITIRDCFIEWAGSCINVSATIAGKQTIIENNHIRYFYDDGIAVGYAPANCATTIRGNYIHSPMSVPTDSDGAHPDAIRLISTASATSDWTGILIEQNVILPGFSRGIHQSILLDDFKTSGRDSGYFFVATIQDNVIVNNIIQGIWIGQAKNCIVRRNTNVSWNKASANTVSILIGLGTVNGTSGGGNVCTDNISDAFSLVSGTTQSNNIEAGRNGTTVDYATLFDGPFNPLTREETVRFFRPRVAAGARLAS